MGRLIEKATGKEWTIAPDQMAGALASGLYDVPEDGTTTVTKDGYVGEVPTAELADRLDAGERQESADSLRDREDMARKEREHDGTAAAIGTGLESFADTASLGAYGLVTDAVLGDEYTENRRERADVHGVADTIGDVAGVIAPALATGGTGAVGAIARSTPVGMAERLGQRIVKSGAEKGLAGQLGRSALGYGVEGGIIGAGEGVQELALSEDPVTLERAVGVIGSKALYGGALGGGVGLAGKALEKGLGRARTMLDDAQTRLQIGGGVADDLASMDKAGLREAKRTTARELGEEVVESTRAINGSSDLFYVTSAADKKVLTDSRKWLRNHLDDPKGLAENPRLVAKSLRKEEEVLRRTIDSQTDALATFQRQDDALLARLDNEIGDMATSSDRVVLKGDEGALYGHLNEIKVTRKRGVTLDKADLEEFRALIQSGAAKKLRTEAMERLPKALEDNISLQAQVDGITNATAPRLAEIQAAQDAFSTGGKKGMLEQAAQGSVFSAVTGATSFLGPLAPLIGAKVSGKVTDIVFGRLGKASANASIRSGKALAAFLDVSKKATRIAPPLASKTLSSVAFGVEPSKIANALAKNPKKGLAGAYLARESELRNITDRGPDGELRMRPGARLGLAERLAPVRAVAPVVADKMETIAARRVSFLASKLPKRPDLPVMHLGPDNWRPSDMAIRQFARFVAAVEDPGAIEERLADGSVTPEDAEAMRTVFPEMFEDLKRRIVESLPELQKSLPYERRLALSIFSGVPVDPAMHPLILAVLQGNYANEPGTEGGTTSPRAEPQFGSISKPDPTAAQERAG